MMMMQDDKIFTTSKNDIKVESGELWRLPLILIKRCDDANLQQINSIHHNNHPFITQYPHHSRAPDHHHLVPHDT